MTASRFVVAVALWTVPAAAPASPRDDLLRLVPDDYTFCLVAQNLRSESKGDGQSSFLKGLNESPIVQGIAQSPEAKKFQAAFETILKELGVTPEQLWNDILGDAVVFAYRKGPAGKPAEEDGLLLVHARDADLLARLVDRINELQTKGGELKGVEPVTAGDEKYFRRQKAMEKEPADYYAVRGHQLIFSGSESLLRETLRKLSRREPAEPAVARRMKQLGVNEAPISFLISPRAFDAELAETMKTGKPAEQAFVRQFATYWKAVDGLAVFLNFSPAIELGLALNVRKQDLPPAAARFFTEAGKRSPLWDRVPEDALFAAVGRFHVESMIETFAAFLSEDDRKQVVEGFNKLSRAFMKPGDLGPLARGFGPDVGFWVTKPDPADKTWCPQAMLAVKIANGPEGARAEKMALKGLDFLARLAGLSDNDVEVFEEEQGDVAITGLSSASLFPPGFRPCFTSKGGYVLVAGSPATIGRFDPPRSAATVAPEVPIVRISVAGWREYLKTHRGGLTEYLGRMKNVDAASLNAQIDALLPLLEGVERLELVQRTGPDRVSLVLRITDKRK
jgi:hypothetical protein